MKILKNLPKAQDFFDRYANLIPTLFWLGVIAQIISGLTEVGIIYNIINTKLSDLPVKMAFETVKTVSVLGAILGTIFFELGLRKFIPYAVKSVLYNRFTGLDKVMSIFILGIAFLLVCGSIALSYNGSKELVNIMSEPTEITTDKADFAYHTSRGEALRAYRADSMTVASTYDNQIVALKNKYKGEIEKQESEIALYERKEARTGNSYQSRKQVHKGNIANIKSKQGTEIAALQGAKRKELKETISIHRNAKKEAKTDYNTKVASIEKSNTTAANKAASKSAMYGGGLAWFTVLCMVVFICSVIIDEVHKKGSEITEQVLVTQYDFLPSAWSRFLKMASEKVSEKLHSKITKWESTTPPPKLPVVQHQLFDLGQIKQERVIVEVERLPDGKYVIPSKLDKTNLIQKSKEEKVLPAPPTDDNFQEGDFSKNEVVNEWETIISEETIADPIDRNLPKNEAPKKPQTPLHKPLIPPQQKEPLNSASTIPNDSNKRTVIKGFLNRQGLKNDDKEKDGYILSLDDLPSGEKSDNKQVIEKVIEKIVYINDLPIKNCIRCGKEFTYKNKKKKYCSTRCRQENWEEKNGKTLKRGRVK